MKVTRNSIKAFKEKQASAIRARLQIEYDLKLNVGRARLDSAVKCLD